MNNYIKSIVDYFFKFCSIEYIFCSKKYKHNYVDLFDIESNSEPEPEPSRVHTSDYQEIIFR